MKKKLLDLKLDLKELKSIANTFDHDFSKEILSLEERIQKEENNQQLKENIFTKKNLSRYKKKIYHRKTKLKKRFQFNQLVTGQNLDFKYYKTYGFYPLISKCFKEDKKRLNKLIRQTNLEDIIGKNSIHKKYSSTAKKRVD